MYDLPAADAALVKDGWLADLEARLEAEAAADDKEFETDDATAVAAADALEADALVQSVNESAH